MINNPKCKQCDSLGKPLKAIINETLDYDNGRIECPGGASAEHPSCFIQKQKRGKKANGS